MEFPLAILIGVSTVIAGWWIQYNFLTDHASYFTDGGDWAVSVGLAFALGFLFLKTKGAKWLEFAVFSATYYFGIDLILTMPNLFSALFSEQWVAEAVRENFFQAHLRITGKTDDKRDYWEGEL